MTDVAATFKRIERSLWAAACLALLTLLGLGLLDAVPWEWVTRVSVALVGISALVARASVQFARRRVEELSVRVAELEAHVSSSIPVTRSKPTLPEGALGTIRGMAADIERRARAEQELARLAAEAAAEVAERRAASVDGVLGMLRESSTPDEAAGEEASSRMREAIAALAEGVAALASQHPTLPERAAERVGQIELIAGGQASLAVELSGLVGLSDRADAVALRCARAGTEATIPAGDLASELAAIAQELAAATARAHAALSACRGASSRAVIAARDNVSEEERAGRELATAARALDALADEARSRAVTAAAQWRDIVSRQSALSARVIDELGHLNTSVGDARCPSDDLDQVLREATRLQAMVARFTESGTP